MAVGPRQPGNWWNEHVNCAIALWCDEALAAGGIHLLTESGRELHTIVPKDAFRDVGRVEGAHPFEAWKYWFPLGEPPSNGLRTIQDVPGRDKPLE